MPLPCPSDVKNLALALLAPLFLLPGCMSPEPKAPNAEEKAFTEAMKMICDVDRLAGVDADKDLLEAGAKRSAYLNEHDRNPDGIELRTLLSVKGASDQAKMLRERAKDCRVSCTLADTLDRTGMGGLTP